MITIRHEIAASALRIAIAVRYLRSGYHQSMEVCTVLVLGVILIIVGYVTGISIIYSIGYILAVIGLILLLLSFTGRAVGGRRWY